MTDRRTKLPGLPQVPTNVDPALSKFLKAMRESVAVRFGKEGVNQFEQVVTFADLQAAGLISGSGGGLKWQIPGINVPIQVPVPGEDLSPPPAPTNVTTIGFFDWIAIEWDDPNLTYNYIIEIFRNSADALGDAVLVGTAIGPSKAYVDQVGNDPTTYYYWVRFVKMASVGRIPGPFNGTAGTPAEVALTPGYIIDVIQGLIDESVLAQALKDRIDLIDAADTVAGSVAARLLAEAQQRLALGQRLDSISSSGDSIEQFYADYQTVVSNLTNGSVDLTTVINRLTAVEQSIDDVNGDLSDVTLQAFYTDYLSTKQTVETDTVTTAGLVTDIDALQTQVNNIEGGFDASVYGSRLTAVETAIDDASTGLSTKASNTRVDTVESDLNTLEGTVSSQATSITQLSADVNGVGGAFEQLASVTARVDGVETDISGLYTLKFDINGRVSGIGLYANATGSEIIFRADKLFAIDPNRSGTFNPATNYASVDALPDQFIFGYAKINGQTRFAINVPAYIPNAYVTDAMIQNVTAGKIFGINATIMNAWIEDGSITNAKIGNEIKSYNYIQGVQGWRLRKDGSIEAHAINIYNAGQLILSSGSGITWNAVNGVVPPEKLGFGVGVNLLNNTDFTGKLASGWVLWPPFNGTACAALMTEKKRTASTTYYPPTLGDALVVQQTVSATSATEKSNGLVACTDIIAPGFDYKIPVIAGKVYEFSAKIGFLRCSGAFRWAFFDSTGAVIGSPVDGVVRTRSWPHNVQEGHFITAPAGATSCSAAFRKYNTSSGSTSYMWIHQPYFGEARVGQTAFSSYSSGVNAGPFSGVTQIGSSNIDSLMAPKSINAATYIQDLSVDTLQIKGRAVTFPVMGHSGEVAILNTPNTTKTVLTLYFTGQGYPMLMHFGLRVYPPFSNNTGYFPTKYRIYINGTLLTPNPATFFETGRNTVNYPDDKSRIVDGTAVNTVGFTYLNTVNGQNKIEVKVTTGSGIAGGGFYGTASIGVLLLEARR